MPLAWFSREECEIYHISMDCYFNEDIRRKDLVLMSVQDVKGFTGFDVCPLCAELSYEGDDGLNAEEPALTSDDILDVVYDKGWRRSCRVWFLTALNRATR